MGGRGAHLTDKPGQMESVAQGPRRAETLCLGRTRPWPRAGLREARRTPAASRDLQVRAEGAWRACPAVHALQALTNSQGGCTVGTINRKEILITREKEGCGGERQYSPKIHCSFKFCIDVHNVTSRYIKRNKKNWQ